jgi:hypothetical protein
LRLWCVGAALALGLWARAAEAKTTHQSPYTYEQTFGSALRLVKVDLGFAITEQDAEWGFLLFEYTSRESGNRKTRGSLEFVRGRDGVQVWVQLPSMPSYHERVIVDKLARKLAEEHGAPPVRAPAKPKREPRKGEDREPGDAESPDADGKPPADSPARDGGAKQRKGSASTD